MLYQPPTYSQLAQVSGLTAAISLSIGFLLGAIVLIKAIRTGQKIIYLFFLSIVFTLSPWYPSGGGYLYWVITGSALPYQWYIIIGIVGIPIAVIAWLDVYLTTINPEKKKSIIMIFLIYSIIFEIWVFYNLFLAPSAPVENMLGIIDYQKNITDIDYKSFTLVYLTSCIGVAVGTGIHFAIKSVKLKESEELRWKGKFLLIAFILFGTASTFDAMIDMDVFTLIIIRLMLMATTFFFYLGFILPKWARRVLNIETE